MGKLDTPNLPGSIHGPVCDVISDPGIAWEAARDDGVVGYILLIELEISAKNSGSGERTRELLSLLRMMERTSSSQGAPVGDNIPKLRKG